MDITLDITDDIGLIQFDDGKKNAFTLDGIKNLTGVFDEADLLVGFSQENQPDLLAWMDGDSESPTGMPAAGCDFH